MISTFPVRGDSGVGRGVYLQILCSCGLFSTVRFGRHRLSISKLSSLFLLLLRSERERKRSLFFFGFRAWKLKQWKFLSFWSRQGHKGWFVALDRLGYAPVQHQLEQMDGSWVYNWWAPHQSTSTQLIFALKDCFVFLMYWMGKVRFTYVNLHI